MIDISLNSGKKFDIVLMNPPYDKGLGEHFLEKCLNITSKLVTVQPATWLFTLKQNKRITTIVDDIYCEIDTFNGLQYFDAGISGLMGIQYFDNDKEHDILINNNLHYKQCADIDVYSYDEFLVKISEHLKHFNDFVWEHKKISSKDNIDNDLWCVKIPQIRGHINRTENKHTEDYFTVISKNDRFLTDNKQIGQWKDICDIGNKNGNTMCICLTFDTRQEMNNFINYLRTDFIRMILLLSKTNINQWSNRCLSKVPWFDFSDEHFSKTPHEIDNWLFDKYNISNEIRKHIEEILPDYYNIRPKTND